MAEGLYIKLGFRYIDDKDFFGHKMKHMVKQLNMTGQYYRHFKGNIYKVLHIAKHSETLEDMVVYQAMYGERSIWVRPKEMFDESIERDGKVIRENMSHRGMKITFVHGIGDGILKAAIRKDLDEILALRCSYSVGDPAVTVVSIR